LNDDDKNDVNDLKETMVRLKGKFMTTIIINLRKLTNKMKTKKRLVTFRYFLLLIWLSKIDDDLKQRTCRDKGQH